jgi:heterodisulfide reductase subunit A-like polyferredoxin
MMGFASLYPSYGLFSISAWVERATQTWKLRLGNCALKETRNWMETIACDVLVIGSGAAGMTTAITAHHFAADVLVVEAHPPISSETSPEADSEGR